jgi:hypothetical protein
MVLILARYLPAITSHEKAIGMPGGVRDENGLEVARNMADT